MLAIIGTPGRDAWLEALDSLKTGDEDCLCERLPQGESPSGGA